MSNELEPLADPGLPEHIHRKADTDPIAAKRAERQVAVLFSLSAFGTVLFLFSFFFVDEDQFIFVPIMGSTNAHQLGIGIGMAMSLLFIGFGAVHWAKTLMPDQEVIAYRHEMRSEDSDRQDFVKAAKAGAETAGLGRRPLIKRSLAAAAGLAGLPAIILLRDLGPLPGNSLNETNWKTGTRLVTDPGDRPIKASDLEVGGVAQVMPSHMGCAVALYEQTTKHLLCPCHQSTFDVTRAAKVIFGPAARPLPQLAITVDSEGYLVAKQPFTEAVGPSFWERKS